MSRVEVDKIQQQCGTTLTVGGGACKTAVVDATTVTLGRCGGTVSLASGATQSGFGRTGTVDWDTTPKTGTVTAVTGKGYFVNTTGGAITVNLPAGAAGSIVAVSDYASTADSNNIIVEANGAELINADDGPYTISTKGLAVTLVYVDGTRGWKSVTGSDADATGVTAAFIVATGGTPCSGAIVCTNYKVHTFTGPGTFCVSAVGNPAGSDTVDYLVVAGGGGSGSGCSGSSDGGGGGGAGGYRESSGTASGCYTASPLGSGVTALPVSVTGYPITVGGGGPGSTNSTGNRGTDGNTSTFSTIDSAGGGAGGSRKISGGSGPIAPGNPGGSGGGGGSQGGADGTGGIGNTPPVSPAQGFPGLDRASPNNQAGAGGGATAVGTIGPSGPTGNTGGAGATSSINATPTARAGGGGSGAPSTGGTGGTGGGGTGTPTSPNVGTVNTGGGGGGGFGSTNGGAGGSGIVIIRYKFQ